MNVLYKVVMNGTIKRLILDKGFGFVAADNSKDFFFHRSVVQDAIFEDLREGMPVTFDESRGPKGPRAENLRPAM
jgi:CspA family cold shock protein